MLALRTLLFTLLVPGSLTVLVPFLLYRLELFRLHLEGLHYGGLVLIGLGMLMYAWCAWDFAAVGRGTPNPADPPRRLVVGGLYRYSRNPMYVGVLAVLLGEALWLESTTLLIYGALVFLAFQLRVLLYEEPLLGKTFGAAYQDYCRRVRRWL